MKQFACGDVVPGCEAMFVGADDGRILEQVGVHATADHELEEISPELVAAVVAAIEPARV